MLEAADPADAALDAHAESAVRHGAEAAQVEIPLERFLRQVVFLDALQQQIEIVEALAAADDLAVAFRREHVDAQRLVRLVRIRLHVERLDRGGVVRHAHRAIELFRQHGLVGAAEIAADLEGQALVEQDLRRLVVMQPRERRLHRFELRGVALEHLQFLLPAIEHARDHRGDQAFGERDHVVEIGVRHLGLDHPELGEVAARLALLGAERRAERVDLAERHRVGFVVELTALRQIRLLVVEVLDRKQRRRAFARGRREDRRVGEDEALRR